MMRRPLRAAALLACSLVAQAGAPDAAGVGAGVETGVETSVELGSQLYLQMCRQCHGPELQSSGAGSFDLRQFPPDDPKRFHAAVMHGKNDGMPAHDDVLSDQDVDALFAYVVATQQAHRQRGTP